MFGDNSVFDISIGLIYRMLIFYSIEVILRANLSRSVWKVPHV